MTVLDIDAAVGDFVTQQPSRARIFERLGIDYCCGGKNRLSEVCRKKGLDPQTIFEQLLEMTDTGEEQCDWTAAPMSELADHIASTHHAYLRKELPRLAGIIQKVTEVHGQRQPELRALNTVFTDFRAELEAHMEREEQVLFPLIHELETVEALPTFPCGSINNPIRVMVDEHDDAGAAMARMRDLTAGYRPPPGTCNSYRAMLDGLAALERDMHVHIHKENNILFLRANWAEARLLAQRPTGHRAMAGST